jgi:endo-1,3(4)-beta-glucanase
MGFVTGVYKNCTPLIQSSVFFRDFQPAGHTNNGATSKFRIVLEDGKTWLLYLTPQSSGGTEQPNRTSNTSIQGRPGFIGVIQVARLPPGCPEDIYDRSAGAYGVFCTLTANVENNHSTYTFSWTKAGMQNPLIM